MRADYETVESALSYDWIWEEGIPVFRSSISSNYHGAAAIALVNKLIEVFRLRFGKLFKGEIMNDKQIRFEIKTTPQQLGFSILMLEWLSLR